MSAASGEDNGVDEAIDLIQRLSKKGVRLWSENGRLHYEAPKGTLTHNEIDKLKTHKDRLVSIFQNASSTEIAPTVRNTRQILSRAPLTYSQLARWNFWQLETRQSPHLISVSLRLHGPIDVDAIRMTIRELVLRHEALRTRIPICDGLPIQVIDPKDDFEVEVVDLAELTVGLREIEIERIIDKHLEPVDVAVGPLFRSRLLVLSEEESMLLLAMDHIISDGVSLRVLLDEFIAAYTQISEKGEFSLPAVPLQFTDYAIWLRDIGESWMEKHSKYWEDHLKGCPRLRFPSDIKSWDVTQSELGSTPFHLDRALTAKLRAWCRLKKTTIVMAIFTAYVALVLRWCNTSDAVFLYESDGRFSQAARSAVGYFTFPLYLRVRIAEDEEFTGLLNKITEEYCNAYEHADYCYLEAQIVPTPAFVRNTCFNWVGKGLKHALNLGKTSVEYSWISPKVRPLANDLLEAIEPSTDFFETEHEIQGYVTFPLYRISVENMTRFARSIPLFVEELLREPCQRIKDISPI